MVKHNNPIPKNHFHKDWQSYVKMWFDQPAKKAARRTARVAKAKKAFPRPVNALRPVVQCTTIKYNTKKRAGRGFTLAELKAAGIVKKAAAGLGIAVDHRRKNRNEEGFTANVDRLKAYKSKVVVLKGLKKDEKQALLALPQITSKATVAIPAASADEEARAITEAELAAPSVYMRMRQITRDEKMWTRREKRLAQKAADKALADKKAAKKADE